MENTEQEYNKLLELYLENRCTPAQLETLMAFLESDSSNRLLLTGLQKQFHRKSDTEQQISREQSSIIREALFQNTRPAPVIAAKKSRWLLAATAAAILIMVFGTGIYFFMGGNRGKQQVALNNNATNPYKNDLSPGSNKAILTLSDGSSIVLDDAKDGNLASQGNTKVVKINGNIAYNASENHSGVPVYNTITTPRGGKYQIELPDGSKVWLNAASSLYFPTSFTADERRVKLTGEAYLEIATNKKTPFILDLNGSEVKVLGTSFNVMAYNEEEVIKTTLLEGSVKFVNGNNTKILLPGQQSQLLRSGKVTILNSVDIDDVMAWKNGMFHFENAGIGTIMRQLARWYDVDVVYENSDITDLFYLEMPQRSMLSDILKVLELTGNIHFQIEGRKLTVKH